MPSLNFEQVLNLDWSVKMLNGYVLVETFDNRSFQKGVFVPITETNTFVPTFGRIVAVGNDETELCIGDNVVFEKYKGERFISDDSKHTFLMLKKDFILATIDEDVSKL